MFQIDEIEMILNEFTKVMFVRHPLERLYSAYNDKFVQNTTFASLFKKLYARNMISFARNIPLQNVNKEGSGLTFNEFLYFLSQRKNIETVQEHWRPMYDLCHPCSIEYDFIGKFENIEKDSNEILNHIGALSPVIKFPPQRASSTPKLLEELSSNVSTNLYTNYENDFKLFGYQKLYL